jgi:hypothetical protein
MAGRGSPSFKKRQKEQQRKEKQLEKFAKRLERKRQNQNGTLAAPEAPPDGAEVAGSEEARAV